MPEKETTKVDSREQILAAAMTCFMAKGYHRATMDDIVAESGLSKGTLYWYFDSKKELFLALMHSVIGDIGSGWGEIVSNTDSSAAEMLRKIFSEFRVELIEMSQFIGIMMEAWALTRHDLDVEKLVKNIYVPYVKYLTHIIEMGINSGEFKVESAQATAELILVLYDGLTLAKGMDVIDSDWDRLLDVTEQILLRGLGVEDGRES